MNKLKDKRILSLLKKSPNEGISLAIDTYGEAVKTICNNILCDCSSEDIEEARNINNKIINETIEKMDEPDKSIFILRFFYFEKI